jgi:hypothetical protein
MRDHAHIVWRRGSDIAHAEIWTRRRNAVVVCIVSDEQPALPSLIQATIAAHGLEVQAAQAYRRDKGQGMVEAVHFLWVPLMRHGVESDAVTPEDVGRISASLQALLRGETDLYTVIERESVPPPKPPVHH